jgi:hypothetical protein
MTVLHNALLLQLGGIMSLGRRSRVDSPGPFIAFQKSIEIIMVVEPGLFATERRIIELAGPASTGRRMHAGGILSCDTHCCDGKGGCRKMLGEILR